jgi:FdhD protein
VQSDLVVRRPVTGAVVLAVDGQDAHEQRDELATEEPMEIRVHGPGQDPAPVAVTMRTPGNDFELAVGLCLTDGIIESQADVDTIAYCLAPDAPEPGEKPEQQYNIVTVRLRRPVADDVRARRYLATSACGVCGKAALDEVEVRCAPVGEGPGVPAGVVRQLPELLAARQNVFDRTGGLHAAGLFTADGELQVMREDVGRHNAVDKVIGWAARQDRLPLAGCVLMVSGRASFELTQKAMMAGIPTLAAVSAPSSLAVELATEVGMTLVGFVRPPRMTVYSGGARLGL